MDFVTWLQENYADDYNAFLELDENGDLSDGFQSEDEDLMSAWNDLLAVFSDEMGTGLKISEESDIKPKN